MISDPYTSLNTPTKTFNLRFAMTHTVWTHTHTLSLYLSLSLSKTDGDVISRYDSRPGLLWCNVIWLREEKQNKWLASRRWEETLPIPANQRVINSESDCGCLVLQTACSLTGWHWSLSDLSLEVHVLSPCSKCSGPDVVHATCYCLRAKGHTVSHGKNAFCATKCSPVWQNHICVQWET